jgi:hypothetical protein
MKQYGSTLLADSAGYVQIELRDESPQAAYFDDLLVRLIKQQRVQQHHYAPWGLPLAGLDTAPDEHPEGSEPGVVNVDLLVELKATALVEAASGPVLALRHDL